MNWKQLDESIKNKEFSGFCLMYGEEEYLKDAAIKRAVSAFVPRGLEDINISKIEADDIDKIEESVRMLPFMAQKRIVIIENFKPFYAGKNQYKSEAVVQAADAVEKMMQQKSDDVCSFFLCRGKVEAANPLFKIFKRGELAVSYDKVTEKEKEAVLKEIADEKGMDISASVINFLINYTGTDLLTLVNELDKLSCYKTGKIQTDDIKKLCHASTDYNVFAMIKAMEQKRKSEALKILKDMLRGGEYAGGIISLIERQFRSYAFIEDIQKEFKQSVDFNELEKRLGVKSFVIEKMYRQGLKIDKEKRDEIIKMCADADYMAKRGRINDVAAVERLVVKLMSM